MNKPIVLQLKVLLIAMAILLGTTSNTMALMVMKTDQVAGHVNKSVDQSHDLLTDLHVTDDSFLIIPALTEEVESEEDAIPDHYSELLAKKIARLDLIILVEYSQTHELLTSKKYILFHALKIHC